MSTQTEHFQSQEALELANQLEQKLTKDNELALISQYRKAGVDSELLRFALNQAALKRRAHLKFGDDVSDLLFTEAGLEQSTRSDVAAWHANRFREANLTTITDLGAGIGADAMAFARAGLEVTAVELNPDSFACLQNNLKPFNTASALLADAGEHQIETAAIWLDPARREQDRKSLTPQRLDPEMFSPNLNFVFEVARRFPSGVKLAPGFPHELIPDDFEANWVSHSSDLVELVLWSKPLGIPGVKKAVIIGAQILKFEGSQAPGKIGALGSYLYEPDVALIRSHLLGDFAREHDLVLISDEIAYLSSNHLVQSPWLRSYRVKEILPLDEKQIRSYCKSNSIGVLEIKKRGVDITPEQLRPKLKLKGTGTATLVLTKVGGARQAIVCEPIR